VSSARQRAALSALDSVRPKAARLDPARNAEENAADIIDVWSATETALRSLIGGSALAGQPLIHDARQRQLIGFDEANRLAGFLAVRDRVQRTDYVPNSTDVVTARDAYRALSDAMMAAPVVAPDAANVAAAGAAEPVSGPVATTTTTARRRPIPLIAVVGVVLLIAALVALWYVMWGPGSYGAYERGLEEYRAGRPEAARAAFEEAARDHRDDARPHIFLARIAREQRDFARARSELETAIRLDPDNAVALREMGSLLFSVGNFDLARRFYINSLEQDPSDPTANGYLGCALVRLGNAPLAMQFFQRAGQGPWTACIPQQPMMPPQYQQPPR
jgi:tetratricopeptide (TPR) repeat protein